MLYVLQLATSTGVAFPSVGPLTFAAAGSHWATLIPIIVVAVLVILNVLGGGKVLTLYVQALFSGAPVTVFQLVGMVFRRVDTRTVVFSHIRATRAGLKTSIDQLESWYLGGIYLPSLITAMIAAQSARIPLTFDQAIAIQKAGRDVVDDVQSSVNPKEWTFPDAAAGREAIAINAQDGGRVRFKFTLVLRTNLGRVLTGASAEMLGQRVEAALKHLIASMPDHREVFAMGDQLAAGVAAMRLDAGAAYEILELRVLPA